VHRLLDHPLDPSRIRRIHLHFRAIHLENKVRRVDGLPDEKSLAVYTDSSARCMATTLVGQAPRSSSRFRERGRERVPLHPRESRAR
jgi:hypothetical protein